MRQGLATTNSLSDSSFLSHFPFGLILSGAFGSPNKCWGVTPQDGKVFNSFTSYFSYFPPSLWNSYEWEVFPLAFLKFSFFENIFSIAPSYWCCVSFPWGSKWIFDFFILLQNPVPLYSFNSVSRNIKIIHRYFFKFIEYIPVNFLSLVNIKRTIALIAFVGSTKMSDVLEDILGLLSPSVDLAECFLLFLVIHGN